MQILLEMLNETDVLPEQQIGLVQAQALKVYAFLQIQTAFPSGHGKGRNTFLTAVCYLTRKENTDILVNPGSADPVLGAVTPAGCPWDTRPSRGFSEILCDFFLCAFSAP